MGLLDDAIREHLDLKRRRGADPAEVERAEREALGPVRRGPEDPATSLADPHADYAPSDDEGWDDLDDERREAMEAEAFEPYDDEPSAGHGAAEPAPHRPAPAAGPGPEPIRFADEVEPAPPAAEDPYEPSTAEFFQAAPSAQEHLAAPPALAPKDNGETVEYDVERAMEAEDAGAVAPPPSPPLPPAPAPPRQAAPPPPPPPPPPQEPVSPPPPPDEDVLEETPEFLQETPDHDRLWFEQRPPRDFDFDG